MKIQQHDGVEVDAAGLRQGFAKHTTEEERCWGGEGCALEGGAAALSSPLYL